MIQAVIPNINTKSSKQNKLATYKGNPTSLFAKATPEASDTAILLGIKKVDFNEGSLYLANLINKAMSNFAKLKLPLPEEIILKTTKPGCYTIPYGEFKTPSTLIFYTDKNWLLSGILKNYNAGQFSTMNPAHPVIHEYGHFLHFSRDFNGNFDRLRGKLITDPVLKNEISEEISNYGASNYLDFVAETFAKIANKEKISASLLKIYKQLGGPLI